nr:MAG TPA: hypothetical protein [Caudoviricetes sp.]
MSTFYCTVWCSLVDLVHSILCKAKSKVSLPTKKTVTRRLFSCQVAS